jgi:hypothetical protein
MIRASLRITCIQASFLSLDTSPSGANLWLLHRIYGYSSVKAEQMKRLSELEKGAHLLLDDQELPHNELHRYHTETIVGQRHESGDLGLLTLEVP